MKTNALRTSLAAGAGLVILSLGSIPALAAQYWLRAEATSASMPGGVSVPMWAFAKCTDATYTTCDPASVPGPALVVPPGEGLTVDVKNNLPQNISIVIPGQVATMTPVWDDGSSGPRPSPTARVRSFTNEASAGGGTASYSWPAVKTGTYLYQSGTHPQVQVQMGLYGAMTKDYAAGQAYSGVTYTTQVTLLYSEIDPALHNAVAGPTPTYGTASGPTSTLNYVPKYFLVNGKPYSAGAPSIATLNVATTTLLRFLNAGLKTHVPVVDGPYMRMIAEDGNAYPWGGNPRQRYSVFLPAAKTMDTTITPQPGTTRIAIYDRALDLTNDKASNGGMLAFLDVVNIGNSPVITSTPVLTATRGQPYSYQVIATDADGGPLTYSLTTAPAGMTINSASGLVSWLPGQGQTGANPVALRVTDPTARFTPQSYTITVAAATGTAPTITSTPSLTATYGVPYTYQVTATDPEGGPFTYSLPTAPAGMTINATTGLVSWTPTKAQVGTRNMTVRVTDPTTLFTNQGPSAIVVANANYAATAVNDSYSMVQGGTLTVTAAAGVLANDTDPDGDTLTAVLVTPPANGTLTLTPNANGALTGGFSYTPPAAAGGTGVTRTFTYAAQDHSGNAISPVLHTSNTATVTISIAANRAPTTVDDTFSAPRRTAAAYTAVVLNVLANDSDPDTALDAANIIAVGTVTIPPAGTPNKGGTATPNPDGTISYTPAQGFRGTENFTYRVRDTRNAQSSAATVRVNVQ